MPKEDKFEKILFEAIEEGLNELGKSAKRAIYFYLKEKFGIDSQNICSNLRKFSRRLNNIFAYPCSGVVKENERSWN